MDIEIAKFVYRTLQRENLDVDLREDYSGRGMFGKTTVGVIIRHKFSIQDAYDIISEELRDLDKEDQADLEDIDPEDVEGSFRKDSLGMGVILY